MSRTTTTYFNTNQIADQTGIAASTWNKRRLAGDGPTYIKAGRRVLYRWQDVEDWLLQRSKGSTSDAP